MNTINTLPTELIERQSALEDEMMDRGKERFLAEVTRARTEKHEGQTQYGIQLIKSLLDPTSKAIKAWLGEAESGKAGRKHTAYRYLCDQDLDVMTFITLKEAIAGIHSDRLIQSIAINIGDELELETKLTWLKSVDKRRLEMTQRWCKRSKNVYYRKRMMDTAVKTAQTDEEWIAWPKDEKLSVGMVLIDLVMKATGILERVSKEHVGKGGKKHNAYYVTGTPAYLEWIGKQVDQASLFLPVFMPTIIPPKPWDGAYNGGYYRLTTVRPIPLVKSKNKNYLAELDALIDCGDAEEVIQAVNAMQETGWRVNKPVLEVMQYVWERSGSESLAGMPARTLSPLPRCPICGVDITFDNTQHRQSHACLETAPEEVSRAWRREAAKVREKNAKLVTKQTQFMRTKMLAEKYRDEAAFYYPYNMDFRGRVYSIPAHLTPQGTDFAKGLLEFSVGKPLGTQEAADWLAIHGANTWGEDKVPFEDRVKWVQDHEALILAIASDPYGNREWHDADSPFCFLAFCFEWSGYKAEGLGFVSHLAIAMDGSCNGLQLFSLMLRDEVGGKAVNVLPSDTPQDVYGIVAAKTIEKLKEKLLTGEEVRSKGKKGEPSELLYDERIEARKWLDIGINRKTTKRQVMVVPYGGTQQSCREYTEAWLKEKVDDGYEWEGSVFKSSMFCAGLIWESIAEVVKAAPEAMRFLQNTASLLNSTNLPVIWHTPCGLPVWQAYRSTKDKRIETKLGDKMLKLTLKEELETLDTRKQRAGISPNYVHSLDASALQRTVCLALKEGIKSFAMIHDSYGTHAADTPALARTLRDVFVDMFGGENLLEKFLGEILLLVPDANPKDIPDLPETGNLDVALVREARFFFA